MQQTFPDNFLMRMDAAAWTEPLIAVDSEFAAQTALKDTLLSGEYADDLVQCPPGADALAWEALELLLPEAARHWPEQFALTQAGTRWTWTHPLRGAALSLTLGDPGTLPHPVLDWLGRQFQEDLVLMGPSSDGEMVCMGGHLCFGSGWSLTDKIGKPILGIHAEVPGFQDAAGKATEGLLRRLKFGRPVGRWNHTLVPTDRLNLAPSLRHEWGMAGQEITPENAGARCFVRTERQTLSRLPRTGGVLFTIHTSLTSVAQIAADPTERRRLRHYIGSIPVEMLAYRGMTAYADFLIAFLE